MSKVIGARVSDKIYNELRQQGKPMTEILREAIDEYISKLNDQSELNVNTCKQAVNNKKIEDKYKETKAKIDVFLSRLEAE